MEPKEQEMKTKSYSLEHKKEIVRNAIKDRQANYTLVDTAKRAGVARDTLVSWAKKFGMVDELNIRPPHKRTKRQTTLITVPIDEPHPIVPKPAVLKKSSPVVALVGEPEQIRSLLSDAVTLFSNKEK